MLKKSFRLTSKDYIKYKKGKTINTPLFYIKIIDNLDNSNDINKLGIIIAKKNLKNRIERNILKRRISYYYMNSNLFKNNKVYIITYTNKENINKSPSYDRIVEDLKNI